MASDVFVTFYFSLNPFAEIFLMALHGVWNATSSCSVHNLQEGPLASVEHLA